MYLRIIGVSLTILALLSPQLAQAGGGEIGEVHRKFAAPQRASYLMNMAVKDAQGKSIGSIHDIVLDLGNGEIRYVAVSFGGFLGLGDKLFAVPWDELEFRTDDNGYHYFFLDVTEEAMTAAPGFDEENWPNFADEKWDQDVRTFYRERSRVIPPADRAQP